MKFPNVCWLIALAILLPFSGTYAQLGIELAEALKVNVVKISTDLKNGDNINGFGIITGEMGDRVYAITAAHVVKGYELSQVPDKIEVEFYINKRTFPAVIVNEDIQLDVVVLEIDKPHFFEFLEWKKDGVDFNAEKYLEVRFIGLNGKWKIIDKGVINEIKDNKIIAQINALPGTSGAPLLSDEGIVGLITDVDAGNETTSVEIGKLKEIVTEDGRFDHMFKLKANPLKSGSAEGKPAEEDDRINHNQMESIKAALTKLGSPSSSERLDAITRLRLYAVTNPNLAIGKTVTERLIDFIKNKLPYRKQNGEGITFDRGTYKAKDITSALKTLQEIRKANNNNIEIDLSTVNFDNVDISGLDFSGFILNHCSFKQAFLTGSKYIGTQFNFADFQECASWNSDFTQASFEKAKFYKSKFMNPVLVGTNIEKGADLRFALFRPIGLAKSQEQVISQFATIQR